jgi:hypothetical protein
MGKVSSLKQLCLNVLDMPANLTKIESKEYFMLVFEKRSTLEDTLTRFEIPVQRLKNHKKKFKAQVTLDLGPNPVDNLWNWFVLVFFHHIRKYRAPIIYRALRYGLLRPESGIEICEILEQVKGSREYPNIVWLLHRDWGYQNPISETLLHRLSTQICVIAQHQHQDAPCMTVYKYPMSRWCPVCIQRLFDYYFIREKHFQCCQNIHPDRWCQKCQRMRRDMSWASLAHLWPVDA